MFITMLKRGQGRFPPRAGPRKARTRSSTPAATPTTSTPAGPEKSDSVSQELSFFDKKDDSGRPAPQEEDIDPMDASKQILPPQGSPTQGSPTQVSAVMEMEDDEEPEGEDYEGNDIFSQKDDTMTAPRARRQSSVPSTRLTGISWSKAKSGSRSNSTVAPRGSVSLDKDSGIPVPIGVPSVPEPRSGKRRKSSMARRTKKPSISGPNIGLIVSEEPGKPTADSAVDANANDEAVIDEEEEEGGESEQDEVESEPEETEQTTSVAEKRPDPILGVHETIKTREELLQQGKKVIYAVAEKEVKGKTVSLLQRFRTGFLTEEDKKRYNLSDRTAKSIQLAPDKVSLTITSIDQLPGNSQRIPHEFLHDIEINPVNMSMKDLCRLNLPVGKVSENIDLVYEAKKRDREAKRYRQTVRYFAKTNWVSLERAQKDIEKAEAEVAAIKNGKKDDNDELDPKVEDPEPSAEEPAKPEEGNTPAASGLQLQVTDGKLDIDADSTVRQQSSKHDAGGRTREETNPFTRPVISNTYSKRKQTDKWSSEEEFRFFRALSDWGTDFSIISDMFPHRNRRQIKSKFNNEEKRRPGLVELALSRKLTPDLAQYKITAQNVKTMRDFEAEKANMREKAEQQKREIIKERERAYKEDQERNRWKEIERKSGQKQPIEKLTKSKQLRQNEEIIGVINR